MSDDQTSMHIDGTTVDELASVEVALSAAEMAAGLAARSNLTIGRLQVNGPVAWMRILAGMVTDLDLLGYKEFHRVGQRVRYHVHLFQESTGNPIGTVDGRRITSLRTASTAAAALRCWAGDRRVRVGLLGSGEEAREGLRTISQAVSVSEAVVFSPTRVNRESFASDMSAELALSVRAAVDQKEVTDSCDVLYVATSSHHVPFLSADALSEIGMVAAIGSTMPVHRELSGDVFVNAGQVIIDTPDAVEESGDCIDGITHGWDPGNAMLLGDYIDAGHDGGIAGYTLFKSIGSIEQDLVLAYRLVEEAKQMNRGTLIDHVGSLRIMR